MRVYTQGSFDLLHRGHINILRKCRQLAGEGGFVVVSLLTDNAYSSYRGHSPVNLFEDRCAVLESLRWVDAVISIDDCSKTGDQIAEVKPNIVVIGSDWAKKNLYKQYGMSPSELDPLLVYTPYTRGISSTEIKGRIKK